jgi:hypothetical protein
MLSAGGWKNITMTEADGGGFDGEPTRWLYVAAHK